MSDRARAIVREEKRRQHDSHKSSSAVLLPLDGGLCVYRALLCRCPRAGSSSSHSHSGSDSAAVAAGSESSSALSVVPLTDGSSRIHMITQKQMSDMRMAAGEEAAATAAAGGPTQSGEAAAVAPLPDHSDRCARILLKSSGSERAMHLSLDKLRYEAVIHRRLADASMSSTDPVAKSRSDLRVAPSPATPTTTTPLAALPSFPSFPSSSSPTCPSSSSPSPSSSVRPHLRELSDFRLALVLPDQGGRLLLQWMEEQWRPAPLPPFHTMSAPVALRSISSATTAATAAATTAAGTIGATGAATVATSIVAVGDPLSPVLERDISASSPSGGGSCSNSSHSSETPLVLSRALPLSSPRGGGGGFSSSASPPLPTVVPSLPSVYAALQATVAIAEELQRLHNCGLVHKSLNPSSILYSPTSKRVQFLDLSCASMLLKDRVEPDLSPSLHSVDSWFYTSPEQSGKANRSIDARSDLYSLGCILHELLTGRPPFVSSDPLELIHMHLARKAPSCIPRSITATKQPALFAALKVAAFIAEKLMRKQAEDRYQSVAGLLHDLRIVLAAMRPAVRCLAPPSASIAKTLCAPIPSCSPSPSSSPSPSHPSSSSSSSASTSSVFSSSFVPTVSSISSSTLAASSVLSASSTLLSAAPLVDPLVALPSTLATLQLGRLDLVSTFRLSQRLYGREEPVRLLRAAYERVCAITTKGGGGSGGGGAGSGSGTEDTAQDTGNPNSSTMMNAPHFFLISGYSGVGKTSLVDELHQCVLSHRGLFARCKFDLFKRDSACLLGAFRQICVQLLVADAATWRVKLLRALGSNAQVLCDVLPELSRLIGDQPPLVKLSPAETANRFNVVFLQFVQCIGTPLSPLTLFIDDLQWADGGSLALLKLLLTSDTGSMLIVGAYRDNEVDEAHPLTKLIADCAQDRSSGGGGDANGAERFSEVKLEPLQADHIQNLLVDSFRCEPEAADGLAHLLFHRTQGNPFHITQLLKSWHDAGLLHFDFGSGQWRWDQQSLYLNSVKEDDVVDLVCARMLTLSAEAQQLLQFAACSGNRFTLLTLQIVTQLPLQQLSHCAVECEQAGLLLCTSHAQDLLLLSERSSTPPESVASNPSSPPSPPSSHSHSSPHNSDASSAASSEPSPTTRLASITLVFAHDRIQAAAYALIPLQEISRVHCVIATQLMASYDEHEIEEYAIDIANHINSGWLQALETNQQSESSDSSGSSNVSLTAPPISAHPSWLTFFAQQNMLERVIELETAAGKQAKASAAYDSALHFFTAALQLLQQAADATEDSAPVAAASPLSSPSAFLRVSSACWRSSAHCVALYLEVALSLSLLSRFSECCECVEFALSHIDRIEDRCQYFELHVLSLNWQRRMEESLKQGFAHLAELGVELLPDMNPELEAWIFSVPNLDDESTFVLHPIFALDEMSSPLDVCAMNVLGSLAPAMFLLSSPLFWPLLLTILDHTRRRGATPECSFALGLMGSFLWPQNKLRESFALGRIGHMLMDKLGDSARSTLPRFHTTVLPLCYPWRYHLANVLERLEAAREEANMLGDVEWQSYLCVWSSDFLFHAQIPLPLAVSKLRALQLKLRQRKWQFPQQFGEIWLNFSTLLSGGIVACPSSPADYSLPMLKFASAVTDGMLHYLNRRSADAVVTLDVATPLLPAVAAIASNSQCNFFMALALLDSCPRCAFPPSTPLLSAWDVPSSSLPMLMPDDYDAAHVTRTLQRVDALIARMQVWASQSACNYLHRLHLLQAERNCLVIFSHLAHVALIPSTMQLYEAAAAGAQRNHFPLDEALSLEMIARFTRQLQRTTISRGLLLKAYGAYSSFGAGMKLRQLEGEFPDVPFSLAVGSAEPQLSPAELNSTPQRATGVAAAASSASTSASSSSSAASRARLSRDSLSTASLDEFSASNTSGSAADPSLQPISVSASSNASATVVAAAAPPPSSSSHSSGAAFTAGNAAGTSALEALSVLKATASFSVEKDQSKLLKRLMRIVLETAGATRGVLVLKEDDEWCVELGGSVELEETANSDSESVDLKRSRTRTRQRRKKERTTTMTTDPAAAVGQEEEEMEDEEEEEAEEERSESASADFSSPEEDLEKQGDTPTAATRTNAPASPPLSLALGSDLDDRIAPSTVESARSGSARGGGGRRRGGGGARSGEMSSSSSQSSYSSYSSGSSASSSNSRLRMGQSRVPGVATVESALPASVFDFALGSTETLLLSDPHKQTDAAYSAFGQDPYFDTHHPRALLCMPVLRAGAVFGVLYLENDYRSAAFTSSHIQLLQLLCGQAALSIDNARLYSALSETNASLEQQVQARTAELEEKNRQLSAAKEAAEAATKIKADFLSNMSHEIRTPMNAVLGIGRLLGDTSLTLEQQQYVQMINSSGHLLLTIINDILDYSKIEAGQLTLNLSSHNLADVAETAIMLCYDMAASKGLCLSWFIDPQLPPALLIDSTRLQQILLNLLSNAIKFTKVGNVDLTIGSRLLPAVAGASSNSAQKFEIEVRVKDTGIGISPAQLAKLFRSFSQVHHSGGEYGGTGLGLVISRRLIEAMQGSMNVESAAGQGSTFSFKLPCESAALIGPGGGGGGSLSNKSSPFVAPRLLGVPTTVMAMASPMARSRSLLTTGLASQIEENLSDILSRPHASASALAASSSSSSLSLSSSAAAAAASSPVMQAREEVRNIHGLLAHERLKLEQTTILFVGERSAAADSWIRTCELYGSTVHVSRTIVEGHEYLLEQQQEASSKSATSPFSHHHTEWSPQSAAAAAAAASSSSNAPPSLFYGHSGFAPAIAPAALFGVVVLDLDTSSASGSPQSSEDACAEMLVGVGSLRILCLYTKQHSCSVALSSAPPSAKQTSDALNQPPPPNPPPTIVHMSDGDTPSTSPPPLLPSPPLMAHGPSASDSAAGATAASASAASATPSLPAGFTIAPHPSLSLSSFSRLCDSSAVVLSPNTVDPASLTVTRSLRRPFKTSAFLRAILKLRTAPTTTTTAAAVAATTSSAMTSAPTTAFATPADRSRTLTPELMQSGGGGSSSGSGSFGVDSGTTDSTLSSSSSTGRRQSDYRRLVASPSLSSRRLLGASPASSSRRLGVGASPSSSSRRLAGGPPPSASSSAHRPKITAISASYPLRILLAEDNVMNQKLMVMLLRKLGYEILVAANGQEVLATLEREAARVGSGGGGVSGGGRPSFEIQCILMDASMDVMDGMECTRVIRAQQLPHRVRPFIIAQTANATDEYRRKCLDSGMDLFTSKPVQLDAIIAGLQAAHQWHAQAAATAASSSVAPTIAE